MGDDPIVKPYPGAMNPDAYPSGGRVSDEEIWNTKHQDDRIRALEAERDSLRTENERLGSMLSDLNDSEVALRTERDEARLAWHAANARLDELTRVDLIGENHGELEHLRVDRDSLRAALEREAGSAQRLADAWAHKGDQPSASFANLAERLRQALTSSEKEKG